MNTQSDKSGHTLFSRSSLLAMVVVSCGMGMVSLTCMLVVLSFRQGGDPTWHSTAPLQQDIQPVSTGEAATTAPLAIGENYTTENYSIALTSASVRHAVRQPLDFDAYADDELSLILEFRIRNFDPRKQLTLYPRGDDDVLPVTTNRISAVDDVGNRIPNNNSGYDAVRYAGQMGEADTIDPESSASHIEVFALPLPKTESILVTINLRCVSDYGQVVYRVPVSSMEGHQLIAEPETAGVVRNE